MVFVLSTAVLFLCDRKLTLLCGFPLSVHGNYSIQCGLANFVFGGGFSTHSLEPTSLVRNRLTREVRFCNEIVFG